MSCSAGELLKRDDSKAGKIRIAAVNYNLTYFKAMPWLLILTRQFKHKGIHLYYHALTKQ